MPTHGHGTTTHGKTKSNNKVKSTLKQIICRCCFHLMHIFEVSRFKVLIFKFFWAFFSKPPDLSVMEVGRSAFSGQTFVSVLFTKINYKYKLYMQPPVTIH